VAGKVGILALQGAFREHREACEALGAGTVEVRRPSHLAGIDALIIPGGESTTICRLLDTAELRAPIEAAIADGLPVLGTCAGMIVLAREVLDGRADQRPLGAIEIAVRRNGYGRQRESFEADLDIEGLTGGSFHGVFIRAPVIESAGEQVEVLARHAGVAVLARHANITVSSFHPELAGDLRLHERFLQEG
jgi:5'-phosphate synthase pdxT subunit